MVRIGDQLRAVDGQAIPPVALLCSPLAPALGAAAAQNAVKRWSKAWASTGSHAALTLSRLTNSDSEEGGARWHTEILAPQLTALRARLGVVAHFAWAPGAVLPRRRGCCATLLQARARGLLARERLRRAWDGVVLLQAACRGALVRLLLGPSYARTTCPLTASLPSSSLHDFLFLVKMRTAALEAHRQRVSSTREWL